MPMAKYRCRPPQASLAPMGRLEATPAAGAGTAETDRKRWLELLAELFDVETIARLDRLGVGAGWRALELGAGGGSIASWLGRRLQPDGTVVATDVDTRFLDSISEPNVEVREHDVLADDFPPDSFDLVHCRAVLVHVDDAERAIERLVGWLRPGGVLLAEEPWTDVELLSPDPVVARVAGVLGTAELDGAFARRLPQTLRDAGLEDVEAEGKLRFFDGGSRLAHFTRHTLAGAGAPLVATGELGRDELQRMLARFDDPASIDCGSLSIAVWGRKPG
jgi:SAM-dependent methyltransferase